MVTGGTWGWGYKILNSQLSIFNRNLVGGLLFQAENKNRSEARIFSIFSKFALTKTYYNLMSGILKRAEHFSASTK